VTRAASAGNSSATVLTISLPLIAMLALNKALSPEVATLIGTAMGSAFGKKDE